MPLKKDFKQKWDPNLALLTSKASALCDSPSLLSPAPSLSQSLAGSQALLITSKTEGREESHLWVPPPVLKIEKACGVFSLADSCPVPVT